MRGLVSAAPGSSPGAPNEALCSEVACGLLSAAWRRRGRAADLGAATETDKVLCDAACLERVGGLPEQVTWHLACLGD